MLRHRHMDCIRKLALNLGVNLTIRRLNRGVSQARKCRTLYHLESCRSIIVPWCAHRWPSPSAYSYRPRYPTSMAYEIFQVYMSSSTVLLPATTPPRWDAQKIRRLHVHLGLYTVLQLLLYEDTKLRPT